MKFINTGEAVWETKMALKHIQYSLLLDLFSVLISAVNIIFHAIANTWQRILQGLEVDIIARGVLVI